jgi:hypothetical protein
MTNSNLPERFSRTDLDNARTKGQVLGWVQGLAVGIGGMILLGMLGWIPAILLVGGGGYLLYKAFSGPSRS